MWLLIREASAARNLQALLPLVQEFGTERIAFCTDDREPEHIAEDGHINSMVRDAVAAGIAPEDALVMATLEPGDLARPATTSARSRPATRPTCSLLPDLESFVPETVLKRGRPVGEIAAAGGARVGQAHRPRPPRRRARLHDPLGRRAGRA